MFPLDQLGSKRLGPTSGKGEGVIANFPPRHEKPGAM